MWTTLILAYLTTTTVPCALAWAMLEDTPQRRRLGLALTIGLLWPLALVYFFCQVFLTLFGLWD